MPLEFALRPRIRLREAPPPRTASPRSRLRVPRFALPAALYWLVVGGICYGIIRLHDAPEPEPVAEARQVSQEPEQPSIAPPVIDAPAERAEPVPEPPPEPSLEPVAAPAAGPERGVSPSVPRVEPEPSLGPPLRARVLGEDVSRALLASRALAPQREPNVRQRALSRQETAREASAALDSQSAPVEPRAPQTAMLPRGNGPSLPSCEAAAAAAVQDLDFASPDRTADLPSEAIAGVLENGAWLGSCALPSATKLEVCVAIKGGRVVAATVTSRPADPGLNACVKQRAAALQFPYSTRVDVARTRF